MKKILALFAVLLALGTVAFFYFQKENSYGDAAAIENAIPSQFPIALESQNWDQLFAKLDTLSYGEIFNKQDWYIGSKIYVNYVNRLLAEASIEKNATDHSLIAYGNAGNSQLGLFMAQEFTDPLSLDELEKGLNERNIKHTKYLFENQEIITVQNFEGVGEASVTIYKGLLLCSFKSSFVEEAILSLGAETNAWQQLAQSISGSEDLLLYVKPKELNYLAAYFLKTDAFDLMSSLDEISGNTLLQVNFFENELNLNGYARNGEGTLLDTIQNANPADNFWLKLLPSNTATYKMVGFGENGFSSTDQIEEKTLLNEVDGSITLYTLESYNEILSDRQGALIPLKSNESFAVLQSLDTTSSEVKEIAGYTIFSTKLGDLVNKSFSLLNYFDAQVYLVHVDDYLILSSNLSVVEQYINSLNEEDLMQSYPANLDFKNSLASKTNLDLFYNLPLMQSYLSSITTDNSWQSAIGMFNIQYSNIGGQTYCQGKLNFKNEQTVYSKNLWTASLDTLANFKPQLVKNHNNDETEILVQDLANNLYLLNASGQLQWKIDISGKIQGDVYQIDYYRNKKLQYVFNTETRIYVVDRNGDNVDGFPISLPGKATNAMLVINYDNSGKYRYMVGCDNGNVYGYEQNGSPLTGWNPMKNVGIVKEAIQHRVIDGKDFIYFNNTEGKFYALDRKGENRFGPVSTACKNNTFDFIGNVFVGGDYGMVSEISPAGKLVSKTILDSAYTKFEPATSILQDTRAYGFAAGGKFKYQLSQWKNFASYTLKDKIVRVESLVNNNNLWFLLYTVNEVYMIDETGNLHPDFPVGTKGNIRLVYLIEGKDRVLLYCDTQGNLKAKEIKWTN